MNAPQKSAPQNVGHAERLKAASLAKAALLAKFKPKATVTDPQFDDRDALRAAELAAVRKDRSAARAKAKAETAERQAAVTEEALAAKRGARKERKALTNAEAKAKRDARYAARKARA
ncbi:DUF6481 family protein [Caulobacter hibisci]|uniref:Treponemal membrane protein B n=1 Tax=Caulobacter hibisci TaxID=2035993 RepID=A0ABS0SY53_9CAUL|nr:DUF6481 family protein [Caulobacter hibisci]MBI1684533.1 hypothetical protein [Caulobacter hibisci]